MGRDKGINLKGNLSVGSVLKTVKNNHEQSAFFNWQTLAFVRNPIGIGVLAPRQADIDGVMNPVAVAVDPVVLDVTRGVADLAAAVLDPHVARLAPLRPP